LIGSLHHVTVGMDRFPELMTDGVGVDGSSLPGYKGVEKGDMLIFPDLDTFFIDPFFDDKTASFLCHLYTVDPLKPFARDPRYIVKKAEAYLRRTLKTDIFFQPELEFYVIDNCSYAEGPGYSFYRIASDEKEGSSVIYPIRPKGGYHIGPPEDKYQNLRNELSKLLGRCGIKTKYHHHEVGPNGQMEIEMRFQPMAQSADEVFIAKYIVKCQAQKRGKWITFMPKPFLAEPGSGLHFHQYLGVRDRSLFYGQQGRNNLSPICLKYIGGILHHSRALCALTNPSTNSYKRLIPGFEAPTYTDFAMGSRNSAIRVPTYIKNKELLDIEYRIPDATANPYFAMTAILLAGIDGIRTNMKPDVREKLPTNSFEALNALKSDYQFLLQDDIFTADLIERWIEVKAREFEEIHLRPHPYEYNLYFGS
jgi:glutamine synthetase